MNVWTRYLFSALARVSFPSGFCAKPTKSNSATEIFTATLNRLLNVIEPASGSPAKTFSANVKVLKVDGLAKALVG